MRHIESRFWRILFYFLFLNVVLGLVSDGFRIVSDTRVNSVIVALHHFSV